MSSIKITSGKFRGRNIESPNLKTTHPMGAREKLALFNMITPYLEGAKVLDVFAGSGALGIEAISLGAKSVTFIEKSHLVAKVIQDNVTSLGINDIAKIFTGDVVNFTTDKKFDLILVDPPYDNFEIKKFEKMAEYLDASGILVLSHPDEAPEIPGLSLVKTRRYAACRISIYENI